MARNNIFKAAKEKALEAASSLENLKKTDDEAKPLVDLLSVKDGVAQASEYLGDKAAEAREKASQAGELLGDKAAEAKDKATVAVKDGSVYVADKATQAKRDFDLRRFRPLTEEQLKESIEIMPEMVHIVDWDKRTEEAVCKDAVAFNDGVKGLHAISILTENAQMMNASFYPAMQEGVYYRDPCNPFSYINLDVYFDYMKKAKVHELNQIAQALGATHIKITLKAEKKESSESKKKFDASAGKIGKIGSSHDRSTVQYESIEVASNKRFKGHEPQMPKLNYFKNEPDIKNIIRRRMDKDNPIFEDTETFKYNNSSGIKTNDAVKVDGVLKKFKIGSSSSIISKAENEEKIFFEYHIEYPE